MKKVLFVLAVILLARQTSAQTTTVCATQTSCTITAASVPQNPTVAWNLETDPSVTGYNVYNGTTLLVSVPATASSTTITLPSFATYTLSVTAVNPTWESPKSAAITVLLQQAQSAPVAPTGFHLVIPGTTCTTTSPLGTTAVTVTDSGCHVFTLVGTQVFRDGVSAAGAGTMFTYVTSGVYVLGTDSNWYHFVLTGTTISWVNVGATKPTT